MFKILKSLSKSLVGSKPKPAEVKPAAKAGSLLDKVNKSAPVAAKVVPTMSPEVLCGITPKMPKEAIMAQLKLLFRRYNRSASSLDAKLRSEADQMLDAIVQVREKHFGEI